MASSEFGFLCVSRPLTLTDEVKEHMAKMCALQLAAPTVKAFSLSQAPGGALVVHFIRHGKASHNEAAEKYGDCVYQKDEYKDARLVETGKAQANDLHRYVSQKIKTEFVIVSPLSRAMQTALIAFEGRPCTFTAHELCREQIGSHLCDMRRSVPELQADFPAINFGLLLTAEDTLYTPEREPKTSLICRCQKFLEFLKLIGASHTEVAVVTHSSFLLAMFACVLDCQHPDLRLWFETCELRSVGLVFPE
jgi:broad specificity phosphatase PhoE